LAGDNTKHSALSALTKVTDQLLRDDSIAQYAAVCIRQKPGTKSDIQVLLITSRNTRRWVIPKGWGMRKKKPHEVAQQEAWEEAGVRGRVRKKPLGYYTYRKKLRGGQEVPSLVQVHLLNASELDQEFPEKGQRELRWFSPLEAAAVVDEPELKSLIASFRSAPS
jgi:8-oxo-dGTP pyrophosphatase MutT (NUDIX family)